MFVVGPVDPEWSPRSGLCVLFGTRVPPASPVGGPATIRRPSTSADVVRTPGSGSGSPRSCNPLFQGIREDREEVERPLLTDVVRDPQGGFVGHEPCRVHLH